VFDTFIRTPRVVTTQGLRRRINRPKHRLLFATYWRCSAVGVLPLIGRIMRSISKKVKMQIIRVFQP